MNSLDSMALLGGIASPYNDLTIPNSMRGVFAVTNAIGFALIILFFAFEVMRLQLATMKKSLDPKAEAPGWVAFLIRTAIIIIVWRNYTWAFLKFVSVCDAVALAMSNEKSWSVILNSISSSGSTSVSFLDLNIPFAASALGLFLLQIVGEVFIVIRYVFLALLYCVGPICWACAISEVGIRAFSGWARSLWNVSFWAVLFAVIKTALIPLIAGAFQQAGAAEAGTVATIYSLVIFSMICMIPSFTEALFAGGHIGAVAGAAMAMISYSNVRSAVAAGDNVQSLLLGNGGGGKGGPPDRHQSVADLARGWKGTDGGPGGVAGVGRGIVGDKLTSLGGKAANAVGSGISAAANFIQKARTR